jgi:uncharacterized membrane protein YjjP (DUF1212 family)
MERIWNLLAAAGLVAAFALFWFGNFDGVFVAAVLGCVFWLLSVRADARARAPKEPRGKERKS